MEGVLEAFVTLFVVMDPVGSLPVLMSLTKGMPAGAIRRNVDRAVFVAGVLLFVFLFLGLQIFSFFGINMNGFQIAGGLILLIIGILYVLGASLKYVKSHGADFSVPIGTPLLTGPGVIMTSVILVKDYGTLVAVTASFLVLLATWLILSNSTRLYKILGGHWTDIISRVMGVILAAIAVKFITDGILGIAMPLI